MCIHTVEHHGIQTFDSVINELLEGRFFFYR